MNEWIGLKETTKVEFKRRLANKKGENGSNDNRNASME